MKKLYFILFALILNSQLFSQVNHSLGLGFGQTRGSATPSIDWVRTEAEINYFLSYKFLIANGKVTTLPFTKFGIENRFFLNLGFTTPQDKLISVQFLAGFGYLSSSRQSKYEGYTYINMGSPCATSSVFVNPFKHKKLIFGFQFLVFRERSVFSRFNSTAYPISYSLNLTYMINKKKDEGIK